MSECINVTITDREYAFLANLADDFCRSIPEQLHWILREKMAASSSVSAEEAHDFAYEGPDTYGDGV